ncbi:MAG: DUF2147 domain-containing protein [Nitratireductor sp.]|nr:DUF2147 domain-containing protein [Nitratireductor sp.]
MGAGTGAGLAQAAEPIEGTWLRPSTQTIVVYAESNGEYCGTVQNGDYKGQSIGCMTGSGGTYKGKVIALDEGKTYTGKAEVNGDVMNLKGCVAIFCKGEDWSRQ